MAGLTDELAGAWPPPPRRPASRPPAGPGSARLDDDAGFGHDLRQRACARGDDGNPHGERLHDRQAGALAEAWEDEARGTGLERGEFVRVEPWCQMDEVRTPKRSAARPMAATSEAVVAAAPASTRIGGHAPPPRGGASARNPDRAEKRLPRSLRAS